MNPRLAAFALPILLFAVPAAAATGNHYVPHVGDQFHFYETIGLGGGAGNYTGYTEETYVNGSVGVNLVQTNGTESASYSQSVDYRNNQGSSNHSSASGDFTFSSQTYLYVKGTDGQTGYTNPYVWFYVNSSAPPGAQFFLLNTPMKLVSRNVSYPIGNPLGEYVVSLFAEGNGSFQRDDSYGVFTAHYNWKSYFDPTTGYIVGYLYTEQDTDAAGDGFAITDALAVTNTSYALTPGVAPPPGPASNHPSSASFAVVATVVVAALALLVIIVLAIVYRSRRSAKLPTHSSQGSIGYGPPPGAPPPIYLTPSGQPAVQQIVMRETVKVNCRYCGALIDTTAKACPNCGAPRS